MAIDSFRTLFRYRRLLFSTVTQGLRARTSGNVLGSLWLVIYPLLFLTMYSAVFVHILNVRLPGIGTNDYILIIFSGLIPFLAFSEAFGSGTLSIVANRGLLRNTLFPIELVVVRDVIVGHASMGIGMVLVWIASAILGHLHWTHFFVPLIYIIQIILIIGLVWISSTLTVFFRDLQQATPILILFLMLVSPIAYTDEMVPHSMKGLLSINPLAYFMRLYRACLLDGYVPLSDLFIVTAISVLFFIIGYRVISSLKPLLADYV